MSAAGLRARYGGWALVTGASSGLGAEFARQLAAEGFPLVLTARREDHLRELAAGLAREHGVETHVVVVDLAEPGGSARLVAEVGDREVGLLVANAGFGLSGRFEEGDLARYERMIQLNCTSPVVLARAYLPAMRARGRGALIVVSSLAGHQPTPFFAVYGATKAFDLVLAEALWDELRGSGVDVLALCPGETRTEFSARAHMAVHGRGMDAPPVVRSALARRGRGPSVVTGWTNKVAAALHRFLPRSWVASATGAVLARQLLGVSKAEARAKGRSRA